MTQLQRATRPQFDVDLAMLGRSAKSQFEGATLNLDKTWSARRPGHVTNYGAAQGARAATWPRVCIGVIDTTADHRSRIHNRCAL